MFFTKVIFRYSNFQYKKHKIMLILLINKNMSTYVVFMAKDIARCQNDVDKTTSF